MSDIIDLLVVGAGPTGIAIGAAAKKAGLSTLLLDKGPLTAAILNFPTYMTFFTTRDKLEIADVPLSVPEEKPTRQQALLYYRNVAALYQLPLALHEEVTEASRMPDGTFIVRSRPLTHGASPTRGAVRTAERCAHAVALATGYFDHPFKLSVPGANLPWVHSYYRDPYRHFQEDVVIIGGGNSACEVALDLWRNGARSVTMVVRGAHLKEGVKYWVRPDVGNRIAEGAIRAHFNSTVVAFHDEPREVEIQSIDGKRQRLKADVAYAFLGFSPDAELQRRCGVRVDPATLVPEHNPETCESNVPGLYIAGTLQAGLDTGRIFIENSRDHGDRIVNHLKQRLQKP
ncbi:MAG TPA: YpdA family putative bacillithiol disulfide reductase [Planctomycetota bacterium]|nr:YpdA family putative bacillithiol disulfide reductase [Planctomycetota bacterium]